MTKKTFCIFKWLSVLKIIEMKNLIRIKSLFFCFMLLFDDAYFIASLVLKRMYPAKIGKS